MSDNTWQFNWIVLLHSNLDVLFRNDPNVFVAGNHLIYAVEGKLNIRQAPDVYVAFGRPKQDRGSYKVWEEGGIFPQAIFEVWSPNNRQQQMEDKREFYERYGAEEYYIVYPEFPMHAEGWRRDGGKLARIPEINGHVSPRLGLRFTLIEGELTIYGPDNRSLRSPTEMAAEMIAERERAAQEKERAAKLAAKLRELGVDPDAV
jgi:Uma2 family endonuclease